MLQKQKILITGVKGTIGQILTQGLDDYEITGLDLPEADLEQYEVINQALSGHSAIIHLAWNTQVDNFKSEKFYAGNSVMFDNVYRAAVENGVKRVIVASSVHIDRFYEWTGSELMSPYKLPNPDSPYGSHKAFMESLGSWYASEKGLEVVCIRFGGITLSNKAHPTHLPERAVFLSQNDGVGLVRAILSAKEVPNNFAIVYGISDNKELVHDLANPFGWSPKDKAEDFLA